MRFEVGLQPDTNYNLDEDHCKTLNTICDFMGKSVELLNRNSVLASHRMAIEQYNENCQVEDSDSLYRLTLDMIYESIAVQYSESSGVDNKVFVAKLLGERN